MTQRLPSAKPGLPQRYSTAYWGSLARQMCLGSSRPVREPCVKEKYRWCMEISILVSKHIHVHIRAGTPAHTTYAPAHINTG